MPCAHYFIRQRRHAFNLFFASNCMCACQGSLTVERDRPAFVSQLMNLVAVIVSNPSGLCWASYIILLVVSGPIVLGQCQISKGKRQEHGSLFSAASR